jgi:hypothetical protein
MVRADARLSSSQVTSTRPSPSERARGRTAASAHRARPRRRADGRTPKPMPADLAQELVEVMTQGDRTEVGLGLHDPPVRGVNHPGLGRERGVGLSTEASEPDRETCAGVDVEVSGEPEAGTGLVGSASHSSRASSQEACSRSVGSTKACLTSMRSVSTGAFCPWLRLVGGPDGRPGEAGRWSRGCRSGSSPRTRARAAPGPCGGRRLPPGGGSQPCA